MSLFKGHARKSQLFVVGFCFFNIFPAHAGPIPEPAVSTFSFEFILAPPLTSTVTELNIGNFAPAEQAGTININLDGSRTSTNGITLLPGDENAGAVKITGADNIGVLVILSNDVVTLTNASNGAASMQFNVGLGNNANATVGQHSNSINCQLDSTGACTVYIGGTLSVGARQAPGSYTGTLNVTDNYI